LIFFQAFLSIDNCGIELIVNHAILFPAMKLIIGLVALFLVALSFAADYKWKQWIAARKQERDHPPSSDPNQQK
jgi:hypothetical protein